MERLKDAGLVRSIGVSNFDDGQLAELMKHAKYPPAANQVRLHFGLLYATSFGGFSVTCHLRDFRLQPSFYLRGLLRERDCTKRMLTKLIDRVPPVRLPPAARHACVLRQEEDRCRGLLFAHVSHLSSVSIHPPLT
jgi:hypothetical protein